MSCPPRNPSPSTLANSMPNSDLCIIINHFHVKRVYVIISIDYCFRYGLLWKLIIQLCSDPYPEVATLANEVARTVTVQIEQDSLVSTYMQFGHNKRPAISSSGSIMRPSPKKGGSSIANLARSKLGHQRSGYVIFVIYIIYYVLLVLNMY